MKPLVFLLAAFTTPLPSFAADPAAHGMTPSVEEWRASIKFPPESGWMLITEAPDRAILYLGSLERAERRGEIAAVLVRVEAMDWMDDSSTGRRYHAAVIRAEFKCEHLASRVLAMTLYESNNFVSSYSESHSFLPSETNWTPSFPDSVGDALRNWACAHT